MPASRRSAPTNRWTSILTTQLTDDALDETERREEVVDSLRSHRVAQAPVVEPLPRQTLVGRRLFSPEPGAASPRLPTLDVRR